jgi:hypothetical protein
MSTRKNIRGIIRAQLCDIFHILGGVSQVTAADSPGYRNALKIGVQRFRSGKFQALQSTMQEAQGLEYPESLHLVVTDSTTGKVL